MKIAFTICSNNYLAQAKTLADSVLTHNPDYFFVICLCDVKHPEIDYNFFSPHIILEAHSIGIESFFDMVKLYNIIELNTSIKPFAFKHLYKKYSNAQSIIYLDPDIYVYTSLAPVERELDDNSILLTPHIYAPIEFDGESPTENTFTQYGLYNLGFLATRKDQNTKEMLSWWAKRLETNCYIKAEEGIFVDQLPMNFAPIFFKKVQISKNRGLNMAPWNLHERHLSLNGTNLLVNGLYPLIFYHFSKFKPLKPEMPFSYYSRVSVEDSPLLRDLYAKYAEQVLANNYKFFSTIWCAYSPKKHL